MSDEEAETIGIRAVAFLAGQPELLLRFVALAGMTVEDLKARLGDPALLGAVLDFVLWDDRLAVSLAETVGIAPERLAEARRRLPGAAEEG